MEKVAVPAGIDIVAIAGPSCSGKTAIARALERALRPDTVTILPLDAYYRDLSHLPHEARVATNFDDPGALDWVLLVEHVRSLSQGETIEAPRYSFATHTREPVPQTVPPARFIILEGLFALYDARIREKSALRVFIDLDGEEGLRRRIIRDTLERGRTAEFAADQYRRLVAPMAELHVTPSRAFADLIVDGKSPINNSAEAIAQCLRQKQRTQ